MAQRRGKFNGELSGFQVVGVDPAYTPRSTRKSAGEPNVSYITDSVIYC